MKVELFTTLGCHLCEEAAQLLDTLRVEQPDLNVVAVEIADSDELMERYGIRIPVVKTEDDRELGWPFNLAELKDFLTSVLPAHMVPQRLRFAGVTVGHRFKRG